MRNKVCSVASTNNNLKGKVHPKVHFLREVESQVSVDDDNSHDGTKTMKASCIMSFKPRHDCARFDSIFIACGNLPVLYTLVQNLEWLLSLSDRQLILNAITLAFFNVL